MSGFGGVEARRRQVLRSGANRPAKPAAEQEEPHHSGQSQRNHKRRDSNQGKSDASNRHVGSCVTRIDRAKVSAEGQLRQIREHHFQSKGYKQGIENRRTHHKIEDAALSGVADPEKSDRSNWQRRKRIDMPEREKVVTGIGAQHDKG